MTIIEGCVFDGSRVIAPTTQPVLDNMKAEDSARYNTYLMYGGEQVDEISLPTLRIIHGLGETPELRAQAELALLRACLYRFGALVLNMDLRTESGPIKINAVLTLHGGDEPIDPNSNPNQVFLIRPEYDLGNALLSIIEDLE